MPDDPGAAVDRLPSSVQTLRAARERLLSTIAGVSEEQFKRRPPADAAAIAGDWSIAEVLAHLLAVEQRRCGRLEALLAGTDESPPPLTDEQREAEARQGRAVPVPQIIHGLLAARRRVERALIESPAASGTDQPRHGDAIAALLRDLVEHESAHTAQIEAVKASLPARDPLRRP
jgi:uncharacterized damage-inducible protein DinB